MTANMGEPQTSATERAPDTPGRIPADTFSNRLLLARALAGHLSIREACERTGLNRGNWQGWERGQRPRDQVEVSQIIADALDVDFNWLLLGGPLAGAQGPRVLPKRPGSFRVTYLRGTERPIGNRPKVREDPARPISPQIGQPRRANRVRLNRPDEVIYAA
jgi:transcriptional regulator with XRE-family HTH domain